MAVYNGAYYLLKGIWRKKNPSKGMIMLQTLFQTKY